ncbi:hypothetical protein [Nocardia sp. alder85J]|uniref:F0F1 ATP synthase subunit B family protein n=1 Tax=Nocardia sp. alder85J TaxID=2862949 RepID=UPI001CD799BB|nr:hypothetical protein [Nocardia sp. alder85J]MCX4095394.1 hypothetical protein [Nocardia sp. alder85J]
MTSTLGLLAEDGYHITVQWKVFASQLVGFVLIIALFVKFVVPPLQKAMARSQDTVRKQLEDSEQAATRLEEAKAAYDSAIAEAQAELERMRADAREDAVRIIEQMREAASAEVERVRKQGRDQITVLRRQLMRDLEADLAAAMLACTEEKVQEQVASPEAVNESIEKFLDDLETLANAAPAVRRWALSRWN